MMRCAPAASSDLSLMCRVCEELFVFLLVPRFHFEPDRRSFESERLANLILKKPLEGEVQLDVAVSEQHKCGRRHGGLGHIEDADTLGHRHRGALEVDPARGSDSSAPL